MLIITATDLHANIHNYEFVANLLGDLNNNNCSNSRRYCAFGFVKKM